MIAFVNYVWFPPVLLLVAACAIAMVERNERKS